MALSPGNISKEGCGFLESQNGKSGKYSYQGGSGFGLSLGPKVSRVWERECHFSKNSTSGVSRERFLYNIYLKNAECQMSCRIYENIHIVLLVDKIR